MSLVVGALSVAVRGSTTNIVSSGLKVPQAVDAGFVNGVDFFVDSPVWNYDPATDRVYLVESTTHQAVELSRTGNYFRWAVGPNDLGGYSAAPGTSVSKTAYVMVSRDTGTDRATLSSQTFTVTLDRRRTFYPTQIPGCVLWCDGWSLTETVGSSVQTWDDYTAKDTDLSQAASGLRPVRRNTGEGRPYLEFDGTDDAMATLTEDFGAPCTAAVVARIRTADSTVRGILQVGGTNGGRIAFDSTNLKGVSGSNVANAAFPGTGVWFVAIMTKAQSGNVTIQLNENAPVVGTSTATVTAGTVQVGDTAADPPAAVDTAFVAVWDSVLPAADIETVADQLKRAYGVP